MPRCLTALLLVALTACASGGARTARIVSAFTRAELPMLRERPALMADRYARMARSPYDFYRGNLPLFALDWRDTHGALSRSRYSLDAPLPNGLGDAHPENFGTLRAADGTLSLEPNDFDAADRVPYLWDLRRLVVGMALCARLANDGDATSGQARRIARSAALAYAHAITRYAHGERPSPVLEDDGNPILADLFRRAASGNERRRELVELTRIEGDARRLRRGVIDPDEPEHLLQDLPEAARAAVDDALRLYRDTLISPPEPSFFAVLDAAREFGSGVASLPRLRVLLLVEGPTSGRDDDVVLELKELADPATSGWSPPWAWSQTVGPRVLASAHTAWSRVDADPLWGVSTWLGMPVQIRTETAAHKTIRASRMEGARGTPEALRELARTLGALLARVHATPTPDGAATAIAARIAGHEDDFADEQARVAVDAARRALSDWRRFREALRARGPLLGFRPDPTVQAPPERRALFETPPTRTP